MNRIDEQPNGLFKRMPLLTAEELSFFNMLAKAIDDNHVIFTKIPLENIIHPSRLYEKSFLVHLDVDYLICDRATSLPICVIDVNSPDYPTPLSYFLNVSGIAVIRLESDITSDELRRKISAAKPVTNMKFPGVLDDVQVTLVDAEQIITKGETKNKTLPKIIYSPIEKTTKEKIITYGHWVIWVGFTIALIITAIAAFKRS